MPSSTDFNVSPYYDDFAENKNFHRVLFRPAFAVQARELTQSQSILQNQLERFGDHVFKQGAMVIPGQLSIDTDFHAIKLTSKSASSLSTYLNSTLTGGSSGVQGFLTKVDVQYGGDRYTAYEDIPGKGPPPQRSSITLNFTELETLSQSHINDGY